MDSPVKQRLKAFIKHEGLSIRQFCLKIGASPAFVANIVKSIQPDRVNSISNQFPDLNIGWLLTGEGEMLKADAMTSTTSNAFTGHTNEEIKQMIANQFKEHLVEMYDEGRAYPAGIVSELLREKEERISALQKEVWELRKELESVQRSRVPDPTNRQRQDK